MVYAFKSRDIVIFNFFKSLLSLFLYLSHPIQNTNLCPLFCIISSVIIYISLFFLFLFCVISFTCLACAFNSIYLFSVTSKLFYLSNCFIFHLPFISWALLAHFFNWFSLISFDHFYCFFEFLSSEKLYRQFLEDRRRLNSVLWNRSFVPYIFGHLPSVFISFLLLAIPVLGSLLPGLFLGVAQIE